MGLAVGWRPIFFIFEVKFKFKFKSNKINLI